MTESTLTLGYTDYQRIVGYELGFGRDSSLWSSDQTSLVDDIIQSGLRKFYYPQVINNEQQHEWSFLRPTTNLTTIADYSTGTVSSSGTTVTLTDGTWPSWAATNGTLVVDNTDYEISSRTNDTVIELESAPSSAFSDDSYTLEHNANYDLPDDFGALNGGFYYPDDVYYPSILIVPYTLIYEYRQVDSSDGYPKYAAIRPKTTDGTDGQRFQALFWPRPNSAWNLIYSYSVLPNKLSESYPYPYGGMAHTETILSAMLATVEQMGDNVEGVHYNTFVRNLTASIKVDQNLCPDHFGYVGDQSNNKSMFSKYFRRNNVTITYEGESIPRG